ncbi:DUF4291 family protein [Kitasatospora sp. NPDC094019]|uniref:DUF4291 family protein n=1 Tax=Kitasatospora sp. NPDC094019 TaxID=3364091 RepID=UPI00380C7D45
MHRAAREGSAPPRPRFGLRLRLRSRPSGEAARRYAHEWTVSITDLTPLVRRIHGHLRDGGTEAARRLLPDERPYPMAGGLPPHLGGRGPTADTRRAGGDDPAVRRRHTISG